MESAGLNQLCAVVVDYPEDLNDCWPRHQWQGVPESDLGQLQQQDDGDLLQVTNQKTGQGAPWLEKRHGDPPGQRPIPH